MHVGTGGVLADRARAAEIRRSVAPTMRVDTPTVAVLDLSGSIPTPAALKELLVPLAQRVRGGEYGPLVLAVTTPDRDLADFVGYLASDYELSLFVAPSPERLREAVPVGDLTVTERATLESVLSIGGTSGVTSSVLANNLGIELTAAGNRLVNLAHEGYLLRFVRSRREGDLYLDPRAMPVASGVSG